MNKDKVIVVDINSLYPNVICNHNISPDTLYAYVSNVNINNQKQFLKDLLKVENDIQEDYFRKFAVGRFAGRIFGIMYFANMLDEIKKYNWTITLNDTIEQISGDALINRIFEKQYIVTANGCIFRSDKLGIFPKYEKYLLKEREVYKKKAKTETEENLRQEASIKEKAFKLIANALYGVFGTSVFDYYNIYIAEAITITGQMISFFLAKYVNDLIDGKDNININLEAIQIGKDALNDKQRYVLYRDTDSLFVHKPANVDIDFVEKINNAGYDILEKSGLKAVKDNIDIFLEHSPKVKLEFEGDAAIFTSAKKRYFIYDSETGKYKITGFINVSNSNIENKFIIKILKDMALGVVNANNKNIYIQKLIQEIQNSIKSELDNLLQQIEEEDSENIDNELLGITKINADLPFNDIRELFSSTDDLKELEKKIKSIPANARAILIYNSLSNDNKLHKGMKCYKLKGSLNMQAINKIMQQIPGNKKVLVQQIVKINQVLFPVNDLDFVKEYINLTELQKKFAEKISKNLISNIIEMVL